MLGWELRQFGKGPILNFTPPEEAESECIGSCEELVHHNEV